MKNVLSSILAAVILSATAAHSANVSFDDLTAGTRYLPGTTFTSDGTDITVGGFTFSSGAAFPGIFAEVETGNLAGGSGLDMQLNNVTLDFAIAPSTSLTLAFGEYGGNVNLGINGILSNVEDFATLNGATVAGVLISVVNGFGNDRGTLSLTGDINSFFIGGQELWIDDVVATAPAVPLPASVLMLGGAVAGFGFMRRRKA
jgi:hypothetical protein